MRRIQDEQGGGARQVDGPDERLDPRSRGDRSPAAGRTVALTLIASAAVAAAALGAPPSQASPAGQASNGSAQSGGQSGVPAINAAAHPGPPAAARPAQPTTHASAHSGPPSHSKGQHRTKGGSSESTRTPTRPTSLWTVTPTARTLADGHSSSVLNMPVNGYAISPPTCVTSDYPTARAMVQTTGTDHVAAGVFYAGELAHSLRVSGVLNGARSGFALSRPFQVHPGNLAGWQVVQFLFGAAGTTGDAQIYNFYVDPRMFR